MECIKKYLLFLTLNLFVNKIPKEKKIKVLLYDYFPILLNTGMLENKNY